MRPLPAMLDVPDHRAFHGIQAALGMYGSLEHELLTALVVADANSKKIEHLSGLWSAHAYPPDTAPSVDASRSGDCEAGYRRSHVDHELASRIRAAN